MPKANQTSFESLHLQDLKIPDQPRDPVLEIPVIDKGLPITGKIDSALLKTLGLR